MDQYTFPDKLKRWTFILMAIGVIAMVVGFFTSGEHAGNRIWTNVLVNGFFFFGIGLAGTFFLALQFASHSGWSVVVKRVMEAVSAYMPIGAIFLILVFLGGTFEWHHIYHWMQEGVMDPTHADYDAIIKGKEPYLNQIFFWARTLVYLGVWSYFTYIFRKRSLEGDINGDDKFHMKNVVLSAIFLVFFGYTSMTASWDWLMSIDVHWFSTIYGWYVFSGMWISGMIVMTVITLYLKSLGHLPEVNDSHIHDLGKWVFGVSFLWSYLFFCQFMLIWYANIPEEVTYYVARIDDYRWLFWGVFAINFVFPMIILMSRDAKRNAKYLIPICVIIFIGHWLDTYLLITPGSMKQDWHLNYVEIGMFLGFLGFFTFIVLTALSKRPLMVKNHPMLNESLHHHIQ